MKKLSKDPIKGRGVELVRSMLDALGRPYEVNSTEVVFKLREEERTPSTKANLDNDGGWKDFGSGDTGDAFTLIARIHGLDISKDFNKIVRLAYGYLNIPIASEPVMQKSATNREELAEQYGLTTDDFRIAGITVAKRYVKALDAEAECVIYPYRHSDGRTVSKWKTLARNDKGKRDIGSEKGASIGNALFGNHEESAGATLVLTGGEEKALAAIKAGFFACSTPSGEQIAKASTIPGWIAAIAPAEVIIAFDNDEAGAKGTRLVAAQLEEAGVPVRVVKWPKGANDSADLNDVFRAGGATGLRGFLESARDAEVVTPTPDTGKPEVRLGVDEYRVANEVIRAIAANAPNIFQRSGSLVRINSDIQPGGRLDVVEPGKAAAPGTIAVSAGTPTINMIPEASLREEITKSVSLMGWSKTEEDWVPFHPPTWLPSAVHKRGEWEHIRPLTSIAEAPFLRHDGSVVQEQGYDAATGTLCRFNGEFMPIAPDPAPEAVQEAVRTLSEAVVDFPFAQPHHKAAWFSALLSVVCRQSYQGRTPLFSISANIRGTGKTLLAHLISIIAFGREVAPSSFSTDDEESRKQITTALMTGAPMFLLDDVEAAFGGTTYNRLLTSSHWRDRLMGGNRDIVLPTMATWFVTGNNLTYRGDIVRRIIPIRLESREENPEDRTDFCHGDLLSWAHSERANLHNAALTIMAGFFAAGRPSVEGAPLGSFEPWSKVIRGAVVWAGLGDPCEARAEVSAEEDTDRTFTESIISILRAIDPQGKGVSTGTLVQKAEEGITARRAGVQASENIDLLDVLGTIAPRGSKLPEARALGVKLGKIRGRVVGGLMIASKIRRGSLVWRVTTTKGAEVQELDLGSDAE